MNPATSLQDLSLSLSLSHLQNSLVKPNDSPPNIFPLQDNSGCNGNVEDPVGEDTTEDKVGTRTEPGLDEITTAFTALRRRGGGTQGWNQ